MKQIMIILACVLTAVCAQAQYVNIMKGGKAVATYKMSEIDAVEFTADEPQPAGIAGTYSCSRAVSLPAMPNLGTVLNDNADVVIADAADGQYSVALPVCEYEMNGTPMNIPAITISPVTFTTYAEFYTAKGQYEGTSEDKTVKVDYDIQVNTLGGITVIADVVYGKMPMTLHFEYTNTAAE